MIGAYRHELRVSLGRSATGIMNEQQPNQLNHALYSYCKVMRVPKLGMVPVVVTVLEGLIITLVIAALGESLLTAVIIGASVSAVFTFLCWLAYRYRAGAAKLLNSYLDADGGSSMYSDFDSAQSYENDQFRLGRQFLFIKRGTVIRLDSISDIVRTISHYRMVPTGVYLSVTVKDESGSMSFPLCRVHMLKAEAEIDEIRKAVLQRQSSRRDC